MTHANELLAAGIRHHQAGRFAEAHQAYQQALKTEPGNADVLSLLGAACINLKQWDAAAEHLGAALAINPAHHTAHDNLGVLLACQQRYGEAIASFRRAVEVNPANAVTWLNLASALVRDNRPAEAIEAFRRSAQLSPDLLKPHEELVRLLMAAGRIADTLPHRRHLARLKPSDPQAQFELAAVLGHCGHWDEAVAAYEATLRLKPDSAESYVNLSQIYVVSKRYDQALVAADRALAMRPAFAEAHLNRGSALAKLSRWDEAEAALREVVRLRPDLVEAHNNLGIVLAERQDWPAAVASYQRALELRPTDADAHYNLGIAELKQGYPRGAISRFDAALIARPEYAEVHHNRSAALLMLGQFAEGFAEYEWRFRSRDYPPLPLRWPVWNGEPLAGRTIVLVGEQGLGDTIQFVRYASLVKAQGARVILQCSAALHPLLARTPGVDAWIDSKTAAEADFCVPLLSLPYRLRTTLATISAEVPYVFADPQRVERWKARLAERPGFKIGIIWQGNPRAPGDAQRSIPLRYFAPLANLPGVQLVSLQKGFGAEQLAALPERAAIWDFGDELDAAGGAFMDTAALMQSLDLVITSDTAPAHLAGALGGAVWVALQTVPDWRWLLERADCPWYPTMRLFRQKAAGDWGEVFERIAKEVSGCNRG